MPDPTLLAVAVVASYLLGSIPTSYLVGRVFGGIDLREHGSGNLGGSNVNRVMGLRFAVPVGLFDAAKGAVPAGVIGPALSGSEVVWAGLGAVAMLGHMFSVWVRFRGGKGAATGTGVLLALAPWATVGALAVWFGVAWWTRTASLATLASCAVAPFLVLLLYPSRPVTVGLVALLCIGVIAAHRSNIRRLLAGAENPVDRDPGDDHSSDTHSR